MASAMSIKLAYRDGVFEPLGWLKAAEKSFDFWDNPADAVDDTL
jgi:hypothetical protein